MLTPCPALAHGACAGALDTMLINLPGAAKKPFALSYSVSVCATLVGIGTSFGVT